MELIEYLKSFNRKERFHLVGQLLGNTAFNLDPNVFRKILDLLELDTPTYYFSAMDYHLDWIYASLNLAHHGMDKPKMRDPSCISATMEDVDFLLAFLDDRGNTHIVMIEAKGETSFTNQQFLSKAKRLGAIFGVNNERWPNVVPHFMICSPVQPKRLDIERVPPFMLNKNQDDLLWFRLYLPANQRKVTRCNGDGHSAKDGDYWKVESIRSL